MVKTHLSRHVGLLIALAGAVFLLSGYAFGYPIDIEDFVSTALTSSLFIEALFRGHNPLWTDSMGLGLPLPFRISLFQHPLSFLFALFSPLTSVKIIVVAQGIAATVVFYLVCRKLRMSSVVSGACAFSFIFSWSSMEYLFYDDYFSNFLSFCMYPMIVWIFMALSEEGDPQRALGLGIALGLTTGLLVATGLASLTLSYLLVIAVFICVPPDVLIRQWRPLSVALVVCALVGSGLVWLLMSEWIRFPASAIRNVHPNASLYDHLYGAFILHFWDASGGSLSDFNRVVLADRHRATGFGAVASIAALIALFMPLGVGGLRFKIAFVAATLFAALPPAIYLDVVTATWVFRDGVNFFGILLFGLLLSRQANRLEKRIPWLVTAICAAQCIPLLIVALPPWWRAIENGRGSERGALNLGVVVKEGNFIHRLKEITAARPGRILMSRQLSQDVRSGLLMHDGFYPNVGPLHGLRIVNVWARGIATGGLHPDMALMEGLINATDTNTRDKNFLDVLGINYVAALEGESVADGLRLAGTIALTNNMRLVVWQNQDAWPSVVELDPRARDLHLKRDLNCSHDRFLCLDFAPLSSMLKGKPAISIEQHGGRISFRLPATDHSRLLLVNSWSHPGWVSSESGVTVFPLFDQLIGVRVSAGVTDVTLVYRPLGLVVGYIVGTLTILIGSVLALISLVSRRRGKLCEGRA